MESNLRASASNLPKAFAVSRKQRRILRKYNRGDLQVHRAQARAFFPRSYKLDGGMLIEGKNNQPAIIAQLALQSTVNLDLNWLFRRLGQHAQPTAQLFFIAEDRRASFVGGQLAQPRIQILSRRTARPLQQRLT